MVTVYSAMLGNSRVTYCQMLPVVTPKAFYGVVHFLNLVLHPGNDGPDFLDVMPNIGNWPRNHSWRRRQ